ncbi:MAG: glycosyltransferase family 1 protein [Phycisphaeraceae bacterium]|nr:glycosyltransferase family 1 protein [Phycisphaeraceae bacterium]
MTRTDLLALGQSRDPYRFIPMATQALLQFPDDAALRFVLATNYARLMLPTLAAEQLDRLPPAAKSDPSTQALRTVLSQIPSERLDLAWLAGNLHSNLRAISSRDDESPRGLATALETWHAWAATKNWFAIRVDEHGRPTATPTNIVWRPRPLSPSIEPPWNSGGGEAGAARPDWFPALFADHRSVADSVILDFNTRSSRPPVTLEGLCPPWLFQRLYAATPDADDGHRVRINLLQAEPLEFLTGLALADLTRELTDPRVRFFVGETAAEAFRTDLHRQIDFRTLGQAFQSAGIRKPISPPITVALQEFQSAQIARQQTLQSQVARIYDSRNKAWYAKRFSEAANGSGDPIRVLIPTCRYSTFIRHSAADIADAFRASGCDARVLIEPDDTTHLAGNAYLAEFAEFKPDLVVLINYPRPTLGEVTPRNVPFVCWVQDPMLHIFDAAVGASQSELDFMVGHTHRELFTRYHYPRERSLGLPVLVNRRKFHPAPADPALIERFASEIAYVSNHGQTPEAFRDSIADSPGMDDGARRIIHALYEQLVHAVGNAHDRPLKPSLAPMIASTARQVLGRDPDPIFVTRMLNNVAMPLADRLMRHQTLHWAADLCERYNWRLRIFGKGWENHPRFREFAQPPLQHGEELRACYQAAAIHLHASIHWMFHQRVLECVSSGGLIAYRYKADDLRQHHAFVVESMLRAGLPLRRSTTFPGVREFDLADHPEGLKYAALCQRLGRAPGQIPFTRASHPVQDLIENRHGLPFTPDTPWLLGDPAETCFRSQAELERIVRAAINSPARRHALSTDIRSRVDRHFTYDRGVDQILGLITRSLTAT